MNNCGISRWDDPNKINAGLKALTDQPIWEVSDDYYENEVLKYYDEKCTKSKAIYEETTYPAVCSTTLPSTSLFL